MKRVSGLFPQIAERENLREAVNRAMRGKRDRAEVRAFLADLETNLSQMGASILNGSLELGRFHQFIIHDPKRRIISAPVFAERVLHHAIMNVCEPVFESFSIYDNYACRVGKGQFAALDRAVYFSKWRTHYLKLDVRKYFESILKERLLEKLARRFRERDMHKLFARIVMSFDPVNPRGVPIGALTSQHFANFYLGFLDRFIKEELRINEYIRYMDDFVVWDNDLGKLHETASVIDTFARDQLNLELKAPSIGKTAFGMEWLGHRVHPDGCRLSRASRRRFRSKYRLVNNLLEAGKIDERGAQERLESLVAFTRHSACVSWRRSVVSSSGSWPETAPTA